MHAKPLGDLSHIVRAIRHEGLDHRDVFVLELGGAPSPPPARSGCLQACQGTFPDQVPLELCQARENVEDELAGRRGGVDLFG